MSRGDEWVDGTSSQPRGRLPYPLGEPYPRRRQGAPLRRKHVMRQEMTGQRYAEGNLFAISWFLPPQKTGQW
jgi:hypothetical protein